MILENFDNFDQIPYDVCAEISKAIFKKVGLKQSRSRYDGNGFWIKHSPDTEDNLIDVFLFVQLFSGEQGESPGYLITIELNSTERNIEERLTIYKEFNQYGLKVDFSQIINYMSSFILRSVKRLGME